MTTGSLAGEPDIRLIVGFSAASASAVLAERLAPALQQILKRRVVVERRVGANGADAAAYVAASVPDGTTLMLATLGTHAVQPHIHRRYNPLADFTPVSLIAISPLIAATHPKTKIRTVRDLIERARKSPRLMAACSAIGGAPHLACALFEELSHTRLKLVVYDETAKLYEDLVAGAADVSFNNIESMLPVIRGPLVPIAVTGQRRSPSAPDLPTFDESGLPGYAVMNWFALVGPRNLPAQTTTTLARAIDTALHTAEMVNSFAASGLERPTPGPVHLTDFIRSELRRWASIASRLAPIPQT